MRLDRAVRAGTGPRAVLILACVTAACGDRSPVPGTATPSGVVAAGPAQPDTASDPGAQVARRIVQAATLADAVAATREAVTRGGVPISSFAGTLEPAVGPVAPFFVLPQEAVVLAFEARRRATLSRLTLAELAAMLQDFGWQFGEEAAPGEQLMGVVAAWVRHARQAPEDPLSFTPLFLADMARRQVPAVDLADSTTSPHAVRLGLLDAQLLLAAFTRGAGTATGARADAAAIPAAAGLRTGSYGASVMSDPCSDAEQWLGDELGEARGLDLGEGMEKALEKLGMSEQGIDRLGKSLDAIELALKLVKLAQLYSSGEIGVEPASEVPAHRPAPGEKRTVSVTARAGVNPDDWKEYQEAIASTEVAGSVKGCLGALGLPSWSDMADIAEEAEKWRVRWVLGRGSPKHALHQLEGNEWLHAGSQNRTMRLERSSETTAEATYTFKLAEEWRDGHPGEELDGEVEVTAELLTAEPPDLETFAGAAAGLVGLIQSIVDLGIGWFQTVVTPKSTLVVPVTYHDDGIHILIEDEEDLDVVVGDDGPSVIRVRTKESSRHLYAGTIRLGEDSLWHGQLVLTSRGDYTQVDTAAVGAVTAGMEQDGEAGLTAMKRTLGMMQNVPTCRGSYEGYQVFAVEGSYVRDQWGGTKVELAIVPVQHPEEYRDTKSCPWEELPRIDGFVTLPNRLVQAEQGTAFTIDPPRPGVRQVYPSGWNRPGNRRSTRIIVNDDFR